MASIAMECINNSGGLNSETARVLSEMTPLTRDRTHAASISLTARVEARQMRHPCSAFLDSHWLLIEFNKYFRYFHIYISDRWRIPLCTRGISPSSNLC